MFPFLKKKAPGSLRNGVELLEFEGQTIALDASLCMHRYARAQGDWALGLMYQVRTLLMSGVRPVYIMDGKPPEAKEATLAARGAARAKALAKAETAIEVKKAGFKITDEENARFQKLCGLVGVHCYVAEGEADPLIAALVKEGVCAAAWSEDADMLTHGCGTVLKGWKGTTVTAVSLPTVLEELDVPFEAFRNMCVRMGTDYAPRLNGPVTSLKKCRTAFDPDTEAAYSDALACFEKDFAMKVPVDLGAALGNELPVAEGLFAALRQEFPRATIGWLQKLVAITRARVD